MGIEGNSLEGGGEHPGKKEWEEVLLFTEAEGGFEVDLVRRYLRFLEDEEGGEEMDFNERERAKCQVQEIIGYWEGETGGEMNEMRDYLNSLKKEEEEETVMVFSMEDVRERFWSNLSKVRGVISGLKSFEDWVKGLEKEEVGEMSSEDSENIMVVMSKVFFDLKKFFGVKEEEIEDMKMYLDVLIKRVQIKGEI